MNLRNVPQWLTPPRCRDAIASKKSLYDIWAVKIKYCKILSSDIYLQVTLQKWLKRTVLYLFTLLLHTCYPRKVVALQAQENIVLDPGK